jgi:hypothetical protein
MYKLTGTIKAIKDTVQVSEKFAKREFVINDASSMYPQDISFQSTQDKVSMLDGYKEGDNVEVSFNLRGREWTSPQGEVKYFNTLEAWRIEAVSEMAGDTPQNIAPSAPTANGGDDDLPF